MLINLDMGKAYNRVNWNFLLQVLNYFGFNEEWIEIIKEILLTPSFLVLISGRSTGFFIFSRGKRQGDTVSTYLLITIAEALMSDQGTKGQLKGLKVTSNHSLTQPVC